MEHVSATIADTIITAKMTPTGHTCADLDMKRNNTKTKPNFDCVVMIRSQLVFEPTVTTFLALCKTHGARPLKCTDQHQSELVSIWILLLLGLKGLEKLPSSVYQQVFG